MRLWTLHPMYLDPSGLVSLWREALLAQAVLGELTMGYRGHPQLTRFRHCPDPESAISHYLLVVYNEALRRGYAFDVGRVRPPRCRPRLPATTGQISYEWRHLKKKLAVRDRAWLRSLANVTPRAHPVFRVSPGGVADWEVSAVKRRPQAR